MFRLKFSVRTRQSIDKSLIIFSHYKSDARVHLSHLFGSRLHTWPHFEYVLCKEGVNTLVHLCSNCVTGIVTSWRDCKLVSAINASSSVLRNVNQSFVNVIVSFRFCVFSSSLWFSCLVLDRFMLTHILSSQHMPAICKPLLMCYLYPGDNERCALHLHTRHL